MNSSNCHRAGPSTVAPSGSRGPSAVSSTGGDLMSSASFLVSPQELWPRLGTGEAPVILDVCRASIHDAMAGLIPTSTWRQPEAHEQWVQQLDGARPIVLACRYGHNLSQMVAADLRQGGLRAQVLEGGYQGWSEAGLPL